MGLYGQYKRRYTGKLHVCSKIELTIRISVSPLWMSAWAPWGSFRLDLLLSGVYATL